MQVKTVIVIEGLADFAMMVIKLFVGLSTNSTAILSDALHSLTDLSNNIIAIIAIRLSEQPSDEDHHYGHRKFEQLAVFSLAVLLVVVSIEIILGALRNYGEVVEQSAVGLIVMLSALLINIGLTVWQHYWARRLDSDLIAADAKHTLSDVLTTVAVIVGWQFSVQGYYWMDTAVALLVAVIVLFLAFKLFTRVIPILVDYSIHSAEELAACVDSIEAVNSVKQIRARNTRSGSFADVTITVDRDLSTIESHGITEKIEEVLATRFNIEDVVVHVEPADD